MKKVRFTKAVATGNDFLIVDNRATRAIYDTPDFAREVCSRKYSVGADGLLILERSGNADFKMRIFNPDGSEAEMCGNGSRCIALYAYVNKIAKEDMTIETRAGILDASVDGDTVKVKLTDPGEITLGVHVSVDGKAYNLERINTGVPHSIYFVEDIESVDVKSIGSGIRRHKEFAPAGTNVDFVKITGPREIRIRTYERGVEDETLACGTGSVASALISAGKKQMKSPVTVITHSGEKLKVYFELVDGKFRNTFLEGKARLVFEGELC